MIIKKIQKIKTTEGSMIPIYRDWDIETNGGHIPKMVYATTLNVGTIKDIIFHEKRTSYLTCIQGKVLLELFLNNELQSFVLDANKQDFVDLVIIPSAIPLKLSNIAEETAIIINCPTPAWNPQDQDTIKFKSWEEFKIWKKD